MAASKRDAPAPAQTFKHKTTGDVITVSGPNVAHYDSDLQPQWERMTSAAVAKAAQADNGGAK